MTTTPPESNCLPGEVPGFLSQTKPPTAEELTEFERRLAEAVKDSGWRVILTPAPPLSRESVKAALALYCGVDADDPETDGGERELASARRALEKIKELADEQQ